MNMSNNKLYQERYISNIYQGGEQKLYILYLVNLLPVKNIPEQCLHSKLMFTSIINASKESVLRVKQPILAIEMVSQNYKTFKKATI